MGRGPISTGTATVFAVVIAAVMMTAVAATLLVPGDGAGITVPGHSPASPVEVVAGYNGTAVIRVAMDAVNLMECRAYLTDPEGGLHNVETAILTNATPTGGRAAYIFYLPVDGRSGYWITDEPEMVFTTAYHPGLTGRRGTRSEASSPAARIIPRLSTPKIFAGARFTIIATSFPASSSGE